MANTEQFEIRIKTALDDAGIKATSDQVKNLTESLDETGKKGDEAHEKITHGAHKAELGHRELREAVHAVANQFGGLADVGLWLNPMTAGLAATLILVEKIKERFAEAKEAAGQLAEQTDRINEARMKGFADSANSAAEAMQSLAIDQQKLNTAYAEGSSAMDNRIKQYSAEVGAVLKVSEAKEQAFEAEIHYQVELGKISKERGEAIIAESKLKLDSQKGAADSAKLQEEIEQRQQELAKAGFRARNSDQQEIRTRQAAESPLASAASASEEAASQAEKDKLKSTFTNSSGVAEEFSGTADELKIRIAKDRAAHEEAGWKGDTRAMEGYQHEIESLEKILHAHEEYVKYLQQVAEHDKQKLAAAKAQTEEAIEQYKHDQEILRIGADQIAVLQNQLELQKQVTAEVQAQHAAAAETNAKTAAHEEFSRVNSGKGTKQEEADFADAQTQQQFRNEAGGDAANDASALISRAREIEAATRGQGKEGIAPYLKELHGILESIMGLSENHATELDSQRDDLAKIKRRLKDMESRANNNRWGR